MQIHKINNEQIRGRDNENEGNLKEGPGKEIEVVWACDAKRRALCRKEVDAK